MNRTAIIPQTIDVELVNAFTKDGAGGNPAGVVLDEYGLSSERRQHVATTLGVSETAFVRPLGDDIYELEFYTPATKMADCGHATLATFALLAQRGMLTASRATKRLSIGDREVTLEGERIFLELPRPKLSPYGNAQDVAASLALPAAALLGDPVIADNGTQMMLVETTCDALASARPDSDAIVRVTANSGTDSLYVFARNAGEYDATIRMFGPGIGIPEESATGTAAGALGGYLARDRECATFTLLQGALMPQPSPSELIVRVEPNGVFVGGSATLLHTLRIPVTPS